MKQTGVAILLVEDDPDMAEIFRLGLSFAGHDVEVTGLPMQQEIMPLM